ncbi:hypothetical protein TPASS_0132 [Treponema pallidum subsp. pallidum SS14]|uniref:Uncharacterized protein n=1 Tax=Treponema pallidum subsp. pallidum (strain SS14) TaxID=455434 RepID=A0A0H3BI93_TREPS|nr:hypothetical protein TPASS_0132 [Treponema pallidum subsp. pallidum SS14]
MEPRMSGSNPTLPLLPRVRRGRRRA